MIETYLESYLTAQLPTLKLYAARLPQKKALFPCALYLLVSTEPVYSLAGYAGLSKARIQIDAWGNSYPDAANLAESIRTKLEGHTGSFGGTTVQNVVRITTFAAPPEPVADSSAAYRYRHVSEYYLFFAESIP